MPGHQTRTWRWGAAVLLLCGPASAGEILNNGDWILRWDNMFGYRAGFRVERPNPALLTNINTDDGDRNFAPGLVSNRFDLLSQLDISTGSFGFDASAAAWYDFVYHQPNHNDSPATFNPYSVPHNRFPRDVRDLQGGYAELVNGFVYGNTEIGGLPFSFRVGRHTLLWGESLFFPENGIAAGQAPVDENRIIGTPDAYARDVYMPVAQAWAAIQLPGGVSLEAYDQFEWRKTRIPGAGSWLSTADYLDAGGERFLLPNGQYFARASDQKASSSGQFGAALRWSNGDIDLGLYALRFNAKDPEIYYRPGLVTALNGLYTSYNRAAPDIASFYPTGVIDPSVTDPAHGLAGSYRLVYPEGIQIYGASASIAIGDSNLAGEISGRTNMPLPSGVLIEVPGYPADPRRNPIYAVGDTLNAQISSTTTFSRSRFWDTAELAVEVAANTRLRVTRNASAADPRDRTEIAFRGLFQPGYFEVLPQINLNLEIGVGMNTADYSTPGSYTGPNGADLELGARATYRVLWRFDVTFTRFIGSPEHQPLADRDFVSFAVQRSF